MSGRRELHLRVKGVNELKVPGDPCQLYDTYCIASYGHVRHRTRLIEDSAAPFWNEEFVFDACLLQEHHEPVVKFELYSQGVFSDELLFYAYLEMDQCEAAEEAFQHKQQQQEANNQAAAAGSEQQHGSRDATSSSSIPEDAELDPAAIAAAAAASRRCIAGSVTGSRVPGGSAARAAADQAAVASDSAAFRTKGLGSSCPGFSSEVQTLSVALLSAQGSGGSSSSNSSGLFGAARNNTFGRAVPGKSLSQTRLKRSTHVKTGGELSVEVWWVQQPSLGNAGTPPRVLSFVHPAGTPHPLPSSTHSTLTSQWEEPPIAFVRLLVARVGLGTAAAAAAGGSSSSSSGAAAKAVLRQLRALLRGDAAAAELQGQQQQQQQQQQSSQPAGLPSRPTLAAIHGPASLGHSLAGGTGTAGWDWEALGLLDDLEEDDEALAEDGGDSKISQQGSRSSHKKVQQSSIGGSSLTGSDGEEEGLTTGDDDDMSVLSEQWGQQAGGLVSGLSGPTSLTGPDSLAGAKQRRKSSRSSRRSRRKASKAAARGSQADKVLHLTVKIQLGDQAQKALKPVPLGPDGSVAVCQSAEFAVVRPLREAVISYELGLGLGPRGPPLLSLVFQYSLLHLLRRSPARPVTWQEWRQVARCSVNGLQVPLPCLPSAFLDLSAFLADADIRAGMYSVPPVAAAALAAAAADDAAAAAAAAAAAEAQAAAAAAAAAEPSDEPLTGSEDGDVDVEQLTNDQLVGEGTSSYTGSHTSSTAAGGGGGGGISGVLRRRVAGTPSVKLQQQHPHQDKAAAAAAAHRPYHGRLEHRLENLKGRASAGVDRVMGRVEEGLQQAVDRLPAPVAQQVKGRFISRLFPTSRRSEVFSIGQLRVMSKPAAATQQYQAPNTTNAHHSMQPLAAAPSGTSSSTAAVAGSFPGTNSQELMQQQWSGGTAFTSSSSGQLSSRPSASVPGTPPAPGSGGDAGLNLSAAAAAAAGAAAAAAVSSSIVPLERHPNVATAGSPGSAPLGVLQLTLQAIHIRGSGSASSGLQLLMRCGPHWLQLQQPALPLSFYNSSGAAASGSTSSISSVSGMEVAAATRVAPVQVLLPVYGSSCLVALVLHKRSYVVARCVFKLYGLMPLLLRDHTKTLTLYSDKRGSSGQKVIAGSVLVRLAAAPPPGYRRPGCALRLAASYLITPHTLEMHTSGVLASMSRDERDDAAGALLMEWLAGSGQGKHAVPESLVGQLVSTGRGHVSATRMRGHVRRIKAVLLDWLPRRLDPLAFYHWRHPRTNLVVMWLLSHVCLYPAHWLFALAVIVTLVLLRRIAIQIRRGVLGFELEQLPPDMAEAAGLPGQQQQHEVPSEEEDVVGELHSLRSAAGATQLGDKLRYKEAADMLRAKIASSKQKLSGRVGSPTHTTTSSGAPPPAAPACFPKSLEELRDQLEAGTLNLDSLDIEAVAKQLLSVGGLLKLARQHSTYLFDYALLAQNLLDDAAGFAEGIYSMMTAQDPLAALLFCGIFLSAAAFCYAYGVGAGVYVVICVLLRPPMLRGVPGIFGWKALLANLPSRSVEELAW